MKVKERITSWDDDIRLWNLTNGLNTHSFVSHTNPMERCRGCLLRLSFMHALCPDDGVSEAGEGGVGW